MNASHDDHLSYEESAGAYVLDALTEEETRDFEAHLEGCTRCRHDVAELRIAAEALPASAPPVAPPPELKERIMSIVRSEAELLQAAGNRADVAQPPRRERRGWRWLSGSLRLRPAIALAAAACVLVLGGALGVALSTGGNDARTIVAKVDHNAAPNASAELRVVDGSGTLRVEGLSNPSGGRVYQVWLQRGDQNPTPTNALFSVRADGTASVSVPGDLKGVKQVMVTAEPPGGSSMPSEAPVIAVSTA
jgi:anti-sigma-K factor RskA